MLSADDQSTVDSTLADGQDGYLNVGSDLVIWTKHFTQFVTYTEAPINGGFSGGGGTYSPSPTPTTIIGSVIDGATGIITDAATGKPVVGANVTLYYANTDRNKTNGKTPDTAVPLPSIAGYKPNNNQDPQTSDANGAYGFMVFPTTDYYIVATKDGYDQYTSPTIAVGQEIVHWDFKMSPINSGVTRLAGQSRVDTALAVSSVAAQLQLPILLVQNNGISDSVRQEIAVIKPSKVCIIGGEGVISTSLESQVTQITGLAQTNIVRIGGTDRYATSLAVDQYFNLGGQNVCVATGSNFPDALAGSVYAANHNAPIILADGSLYSC